MMNDSPFDERFQLLRESGQAGEQAITLTWLIIQQVEQAFSLTLNEDNGGMFVQHVVIALQRLIDGAALNEPPSVVLHEARAFVNEWAYAETVAESLARTLGKRFPDGEIGYLTLHLARLKQEANE
jgi:transcriptional regulatory protein LevR